jgi:hypothetical protein
VIVVTAWIPARTIVRASPEGGPYGENASYTVGGVFGEMAISHKRIRAIEPAIDPQHEECTSQIVFDDNTAIQVQEDLGELLSQFADAQAEAAVRYAPADYALRMRGDVN